MPYKTRIYRSPIGPLELIKGENDLIELRFTNKAANDTDTEYRDSLLDNVQDQLDLYFKGDLSDFDIPISPSGTQFEQTVWKLLRAIPYGSTVTYGELAKKLGDPGAVRAVGKANGRNPIPVIIPCHRVVGSNNKLTGYSGGIERKKWLLRHEGAVLI